MEEARTSIHVSESVKSVIDSRSCVNDESIAATKIQKLYKGYRTRRNLADCTVAVELLWQMTLFDVQKVGRVAAVDIESEKHIVSLLQWAETKIEMLGHLSNDELVLQHCLEAIDPLHRFSQNLHFYHRIWDWHKKMNKESFLESWKYDSNKIGDLKRAESLFTIGKPEFGELRRDRTTAAENGLSKLMKAWKTWKGALQHWLEVIDLRHRDGHNLNFYFQIWINISSDQPFFYWLDVGDGKTLNHLKCSKKTLHHQRIKYFERNEREEYKVIVKDGRLVYLQNYRPIHTTGDSKWIFVLSETKNVFQPENKEVNFYVGKKVEGTKHSSFLSRGSTSIAAGRVVADNGILKEILPQYCHHLPIDKNQNAYMSFLEQHRADLSQLSNVEANTSEYGATGSAVESPAPSTSLHTYIEGGGGGGGGGYDDDINRNQQANTLEYEVAGSAVESPAPSNSVKIDIKGGGGGGRGGGGGYDDDINRNQVFGRRIIYFTNLVMEIASAVFESLSSERKPRYALIALLLSIIALFMSLIHLAYTGRKVGVRWEWKGWRTWWYHKSPPKKIFGNLVDMIGLLFSIFQLAFAIAAYYHYLSHQQGNPPQFSVYTITFAFCLLCSKF